MADEKPPAWTSSEGIGQVPLALSADVDATKVNPVSGQDANARAANIIREQQPVINRFVKNQRQQIEIGDLAIRKSVLPLSDMDVYYSYVQGLERMHYHVTPSVEEPVEEPKPSEEEEPKAAPTIEARTPEEPAPKEPEPEELEEEVPEEEPEDEPEEEELEEEPAEVELESPGFLEVDIPCFLAVKFGDGAGDPP